MKTKVCTKCKITKSLTDFDHYNDKSRGKVRVRGHCKDCRRTMVKTYDESNKSKKSEYNKKYKISNKDYLRVVNKEYYEKNREWRLSYLKDWRNNNPDVVAYHGVKRRQKNRQATPDWLTKEQKGHIKAIYQHAKDCNLVGEGSYEVDHIIPIQGESVCGLHVPWNLQVIPMDVNRAKNNQYGPDTDRPTA